MIVTNPPHLPREITLNCGRQERWAVKISWSSASMPRHWKRTKSWEEKLSFWETPKKVTSGGHGCPAVPLTTLGFTVAISLLDSSYLIGWGIIVAPTALDLVWSLQLDAEYGTWFPVIHCLVPVKHLNPQHLSKHFWWNKPQVSLALLFSGSRRWEVGANSSATAHRGWPDSLNFWWVSVWRQLHVELPAYKIVCQNGTSVMFCKFSKATLMVSCWLLNSVEGLSNRKIPVIWLHLSLWKWTVHSNLAVAMAVW